MTLQRIAVFGDVHGCIDELVELDRLLQHESLDARFHLGDLVDRGPDSGAVVQYCRERGIDGVQGNHESTILPLLGTTKGSDDKQRTVQSLKSEDADYIWRLPPLRVIDEMGLVLVHGGLFPGLPLFLQPPKMINRLQMVHPEHPGNSKMAATKWWKTDRDNVTEEENRKAGWVRWYEVCDEPYKVLYGHSVFEFPFIYENGIGGGTLGLDTGCVYGGSLTAVILPDLKFVSVPARKVYFNKRKD